MKEYDVVVIGAGTGGYVAAIRAAQLGLTVAVVEKQKALGGTCLIWGCIPTKALLEHAHALKVVQQAKEWGVTGALGADRHRHGAGARAQGSHRRRPDEGRRVSLQEEQDRLDQRHRAADRQRRNRSTCSRATSRRCARARRSSSRPARRRAACPASTIDRKRIITSDEAIHLPEVPKSIAILGSGAVGVEFASIFRRFGSDVTIFELLPRLVPVEDEAVSAELEKSFRKQGITSHTGAKVTKAVATGDAVDIEAQLADGTTKSLRADYLLVATGRGPVTTGLEVERLGLQMEKGYIAVDAMYRTNVPGISAIGDVITVRGVQTHPQLAHVSSAEGIVAAERIAGRETRAINYDHVPGCTYCEPEIGSVGLTERKAKERGYDVRVGTFPFGVLARAKMAGEVEGFVKIVADKKYDEVLGVHMIGLRSTELVAEATLALRLESTVEELIRTIHAHPTMAEAVGEAAHATHGAAIHIMRSGN